MRCFVIEPVRNVDINAADKFGNIVVLFPAGVSRPSIWEESYVAAVLKKLASYSYDPDTDYLVIAGPVVPLVKVIGMLCSTYSKIRALCWSASERDYILQEIGHEREHSTSV